MYAQCDPSWVRKCNVFQVMISVVLVVSAWMSRSHGPVGLVWANCTQMSLRIVLCGVFTQRHLSLKWEDLSILPIFKLFGIMAAGGFGCSFLVPSVADGVPWLQAAKAVVSACIAIGVGLLLC